MKQLTFLDDNLIDIYYIIVDVRRMRFVVTNGRVSAAPRSANWAVGLPIARVLNWYAGIGAQVITLTEEGTDHERAELSGQDPDRRV